MTQGAGRQTRRPGRARGAGAEPWKVVTAVALGSIAIAAVLWITFAIDPHDQFQQNVAWAVLALGIAGAAAVLPGFINLDIPKLAKAGGSIAIFVLVYTQSPAGKAVIDQVIPPGGDPKETADSYLALVDGEHYRQAYAAASGWTRDHFTLVVFLQLLTTERKPLGAPHRVLWGEQALDNPPGMPPGAYRTIVYKTDFAGAPGKSWAEAVAVGAEQRAWKVFSYTIAPMP